MYARTTVTVIAAGWIGFGVGMAFAVGVMAARARSPITNANASAQALDSRADDMRCPIPVSAGRNPADGAASCLTYLIIWSDGCPTVFDRDFGTMFRFGCGPGWNRKTHVQDPTAGVVPPPWRRANRSSARPRPPRGRVAAATLGLIEARDLLVPSRERVRVLESRDHLDRLEQMCLRLRPVAALREHEAQVRLGRRQGDRIADRLRETDRALRICGRGLDRSKPEEIIDRVR